MVSVWIKSIASSVCVHLVSAHHLPLFSLKAQSSRATGKGGENVCGLYMRKSLKWALQDRSMWRNGEFVSASGSSTSFVARSPSVFRMAHDRSVCVCISERSYLTEVFCRLFRSFFFYPPWVIFLKPLCEIFIFRYFTLGPKTGNTSQFFPKNALYLLLLPRAIVEDVLDFLPQTVASQVVSTERFPFLWSCTHLFEDPLYDHLVPTSVRRETCTGKKQRWRHTQWPLMPWASRSYSSFLLGE